MVPDMQGQGVLAAIEEPVRFARRRFGHDDVIDGVAVLFGSAIRGERTWEAFDERIEPWAEPFLALCGRDRLPARCTLSRLLSALDLAAVEALRPVLLTDLLARPLPQAEPPDGRFDRPGKHFRVFAVDGTERRGPPTRLAAHGRSTSPSPAPSPAVRSRLHGTPARGGRAHQDDGSAGSYPSVVDDKWN